MSLWFKIYDYEKLTPVAALKDCLQGYQNPVPAEVLAFQIELAIREASDLDFVPPELRPKPNSTIEPQRHRGTEEILEK